MAGYVCPIILFWLVQVVVCSVTVGTFWSDIFTLEVAIAGHSEAVPTSTPSACGNLCTGFPSCQSFGFSADSHTCWLYVHLVEYTTKGTAAPGTRYFWRLSPRCPTELGYTLEEGLCYKIHHKNMLIGDARALCRRDGASLFVADTAAKRDFLKTRMRGKVWLGASDSDVEGVWRWLDGTLVDLDPEPWEPYQPDDHGKAGQDTACLETSGRMDDLGRKARCHVPCQIPLQ